MIQTKTVAFSIVAIVAVMAVFAATPFVVGHEAQAFFGRGGFGRGFGGNDNSQGNNNIQGGFGENVQGNQN